jgi:hypothetical protein
MTEQEFWEIVGALRWQDDFGDDRIKSELMERFPTPESIAPFRSIYEKKVGALKSAIGDHCSDSFDDVTAHIVGLGREQYEAALADPNLARERWDVGNYEESFAYGVPHAEDYQKQNVSHYARWAQNMIDEYGAAVPQIQRAAVVVRAFTKLKDGDVQGFREMEAEAREAAQEVADFAEELRRQAETVPGSPWGVFNAYTDVNQYVPKPPTGLGGGGEPIGLGGTPWTPGDPPVRS